MSVPLSFISSLVSSAENAWSASQNRQSSENISRLNRNSTEEIARLSREHSAELQYRQIKFSILQQRENQDFQRELAELNQERAREIEAFRAEVNFAINQKNLDFQKWRFEQEKKIQYEILQLEQNFQRELSTIEHQNALTQLRERIREDKSPIANLAYDLLENSFAHGIMPLKVLLVPPALDYDPSTGKPYEAGYESFLSKEIEQFLHGGYLNSKQYPVQLLDRAWESNKQGGGSALQALHGQLKSIPILVLQSEIALGELNFSLGYWSGGDVSYTQATILSGQSWLDLLYASAKKRALDWQVTRRKLEDFGRDEAYIKNMGGVNEVNLQILYRELAEKEELEQYGIDTSNLPVSKEYEITEQDYKSVYQYLAVWHCLVIGLYADILFLGNSWENTPLLPSLIPYLLDRYKNHCLLTPEFWQEGIATIVKAYGQFYDSLQSGSAYCLPEIRLKLALSLANLPNEYQYLALEQGNKAFSDWLRANNVPSAKVFDLDNNDDCQLLKRIVYQEDKPFLEALKLLLDKVKDAQGIKESQTRGINSLLRGWQLLDRFGSIPHLPKMERVALPESAKPEVEEFPPLSVFTFEVKTVNKSGGVIQRRSESAKYYSESLPLSASLEMVAIPGGSFTMGSPSGEGYDREKPQHQVIVPPFFMGKYPVTQKQWQAVASLPKIARDLESNPSGFKGNDLPVERVNWDDAVEFCQRLSKQTGRQYRLPSEAEWEYACRAGTTTPFYCGETITTELANYDGNYTYANGPKGEYRQKTTPVTQFPPNPWGLSDLHGNVWEWCADNWHGNYTGAPTDGSAWLNNENDHDSSSMLRGGSWYDQPFGCRSAYRLFYYRRDDYDNPVGFRVVCVVGRIL